MTTKFIEEGYPDGFEGVVLTPTEQKELVAATAVAYAIEHVKKQTISGPTLDFALQMPFQRKLYFVCLIVLPLHTIPASLIVLSGQLGISNPNIAASTDGADKDIFLVGCPLSFTANCFFALTSSSACLLFAPERTKRILWSWIL